MTLFDDQIAGLLEAVRQAGLSAKALWLGSLGLSGTMTLAEVVAITTSQRRPSLVEYNALAVAVNDHFVGVGGDHPVAYRFH